VTSTRGPSWYLSVETGQVAERVVLVGDPERIELFADRLSGAERLTTDRALRTVTGRYGGTRVTVCSFGMGAPIAIVVLEELAQLGARIALRAGTVMTLGRVELGTLVLAHAAVRGESTSASYVPPGYPAVADPDLLACARRVLERRGDRFVVGLVGSYDGFYSQLFAARPERRESVARLAGELDRLGVLATDMETSAILAIAPMLGVRAGSLCVASVDGMTQHRLSGESRRAAEERLVEAALDIVTDVPLEAR
jgi:uridine phosphorylase